MAAGPTHMGVCGCWWGLLCSGAHPHGCCGVVLCALFGCGARTPGPSVWVVLGGDCYTELAWRRRWFRCGSCTPRTRHGGRGDVDRVYRRRVHAAHGRVEPRDVTSAAVPAVQRCRGDRRTGCHFIVLLSSRSREARPGVYRLLRIGLHSEVGGSTHPKGVCSLSDCMYMFLSENLTPYILGVSGTGSVPLCCFCDFRDLEDPT